MIVIPCREDEPKTAPPAQHTEVDKGADNLEKDNMDLLLFFHKVAAKRR
jgi:hypothetical protein